MDWWEWIQRRGDGPSWWYGKVRGHLSSGSQPALTTLETCLSSWRWSTPGSPGTTWSWTLTRLKTTWTGALTTEEWFHPSDAEYLVFRLRKVSAAKVLLMINGLYIDVAYDYCTVCPEKVVHLFLSKFQYLLSVLWKQFCLIGSLHTLFLYSYASYRNFNHYFHCLDITFDWIMKLWLFQFFSFDELFLFYHNFWLENDIEV